MITKSMLISLYYNTVNLWQPIFVVWFVIISCNNWTTVANTEKQRVCELISIPMCRGIGYNYTVMPNQLSHKNQAEAGLEVHHFWPLLEIECSKDLRFFLCALHAPVCVENNAETRVTVCRSVCERARDGCAPIMKQYGFAWPEALTCNDLPLRGDEQRICVDEIKDVKLIEAKLKSMQPNKTDKRDDHNVSDSNKNSVETDPTTDRNVDENNNNNKIKVTDTKSTEHRFTLSVTDASIRKQQLVCEPISMPMCRGIGYNYTVMPNHFNHENQDKASLEVHQYWPLVRISCSEQLKLFLCSLYVPICIEDYAETRIPVCRSVCERAREGCAPVMNQFGFAWPEELGCNELPVSGDQQRFCVDEIKDVKLIESKLRSMQRTHNKIDQQVDSTSAEISNENELSSPTTDRNVLKIKTTTTDRNVRGINQSIASHTESTEQTIDKSDSVSSNEVAINNTNNSVAQHRTANVSEITECVVDCDKNDALLHKQLMNLSEMIQKCLTFLNRLLETSGRKMTNA